MIKSYLMIFLVSMVPLIELRGAMPIAMGMDLPFLPALVTCVIGNMLPVPIIYFFARKVLSVFSDQGRTCRSEAGKKSRPGRTVSGADAVCGHSAAGNRCLDRGVGCQFFEYGHQIHRPVGFAGCGDGRYYHGRGQHRCAECVRSLIAFIFAER